MTPNVLWCGVYLVSETNYVYTKKTQTLLLLVLHLEALALPGFENKQREAHADMYTLCSISALGRDNAPPAVMYITK